MVQKNGQKTRVKICLENYKYQDYPLNNLISKLNISRDTSRNPLFDTLFTYQNNGLSNINFNGISSKLYIPDNKISKINNVLLLFFGLYILALKTISQNYIFLIFWKYIFINFDTFLKIEIFISLK